MSETPTGFDQVAPDVLRRQAVEDWAVEVKPADSLKKVVKALEEAGIYWDDYAERYGYNVVNTLDAPDSVDSLEPTPGPAPTVAATTPEPQAQAIQRSPEPTRQERPVEEFIDRSPPKPQVAFAQAPVVEQNVQYLVKMERPNVRYQIGKYVFTQSHPFALVDGTDLEYVLRHEPGFRQAWPSEAAEFYA